MAGWNDLSSIFSSLTTAISKNVSNNMYLDRILTVYHTFKFFDMKYGIIGIYMIAFSSTFRKLD